MSQYFSNAPNNIFTNPDYLHYLVEYTGDLEKEASLNPIYYITIINDKYAIISVPFSDIRTDMLRLSNNPFPSVIYISRYYFYTLQSLSPVVAANINLVQIQPPFYLTGKDVVVGMIDTGIDYLNKEFLNEDGSSRIISIWDQTISSSDVNSTVPFGTIYSNKEINAAILAHNENRNPYDIVPTKDEIGHGTAMAGIIGAKGVNPELKGAAPDCEYLIVKLAPDIRAMNLLETKTPVYNQASIYVALNYLVQYSISINKPIAIYLPLGTTFGNHRGYGILEDAINELSYNKGVIIVTGSGNEGDGYGHASGRLYSKGSFTDIPIVISENISLLRLEIWTDKPNIMSIDIISAAGNNTGIINASQNLSHTSKFIFESTSVSVNYFLPEEITGDELIEIDFFNITSGVWKIRLYADYVLSGTYNIWMLQKEILPPGTEFLIADSYGTLTNPGSSLFIVNAANYNQNNFYLVKSSGMAFQNQLEDAIDIAAGGVDAKAPAPNNGVTVVSGASVSAAVVTGACAILLQWGVVEGNDPGMYSQKIKAYLQRGTKKRTNDVYPNAEWGYGVLDMEGVFKYLE